MVHLGYSATTLSVNLCTKPGANTQGMFNGISIRVTRLARLAKALHKGARLHRLHLTVGWQPASIMYRVPHVSKVYSQPACRYIWMTELFTPTPCRRLCFKWTFGEPGALTLDCRKTKTKSKFPEKQQLNNSWSCSTVQQHGSETGSNFWGSQVLLRDDAGTREGCEAL